MILNAVNLLLIFRFLAFAGSPSNESESSEKEKIQVEPLGKKKIELEPLEKKKIDFEPSEEEKIGLESPEEEKMELKTLEEKKIELELLVEKKIELALLKQKTKELEKLEDEFVAKFRELNNDVSLMSYSSEERGNQSCHKKTITAIENNVPLFFDTIPDQPITEKDLNCEETKFFHQNEGPRILFRNPAYEPIGPLAALYCVIWIWPEGGYSEYLEPFYALKGGYLVAEETMLIIGKI